MTETGAESPQIDKHDRVHLAQGDSVQDALVGTIFDNKYELIASYGSGATGTVYKANDILLQRRVALKLIHSYLLSSPKAIERFKVEGSTSRSLSHPNIAKVYNQGIATDGRLYMVMDCLEGESLSDKITREGKLSLPVFFDLFIQVVEALKYAHSQGVIHRDLKPNNIIITTDGAALKASIVDFGLAKCIDQNNDQGSTQTGAMLGSSAYMSPEQCIGTGSIDVRADIYALGCVMLEALAGRSPFQGESALDVMYKHLNESLGELGFLKEMPESLSALLKKCIQKDPNLRYQNMEELKIDFQKCSDMRDTLNRKWRHIQKTSGLKRNVLLGTVILTSASAAAVSIYLLQLESGRQKQLGANSLSTDKSPPLPEKVKIHLHTADFLPQAENIKKFYGPQGELQLLDRWQTSHAKDATEDEKLQVELRYVTDFVAISNRVQAEKHAKIIFSRAQKDAVVVAAKLLIELYGKQGKPEDGLALVERILREHPEIQKDQRCNAYILASKAICYMQMHRYDEALALLQTSNKVLKAAPKAIDNTIKYQLIRALCLTGRKNEAGVIAKEALAAAKLDPKRESNLRISILWHLALAYLDTDELSEGMSLLEKLKTEAAANNDKFMFTECLQILANCYRQLGKSDTSLEMQKQILLLQNDWHDKTLILLSMSTDASTLGKTKLSYEYADQALSYCQKYLDGFSPLTRSRVKESILSSPITRFRDLFNAEKKSLEAEQLLTKWIVILQKRLPDSVALSNLYLSYAQELNWSGRREEAITYADKAINLLSTLTREELVYKVALSDAYTTKAACCLEAKQYENAIAAVNYGLKILEQVPDSADRKINYLLYLGHAYNGLHKQQEAKETLDQIKPLWFQTHKKWTRENTEQLRQLADYYCTIDKHDEAKHLYRECRAGLEKHFRRKIDESRMYSCKIAECLIHQNKLNEAHKLLTEALVFSKELGKKDYWDFRTLQQLGDVCSRMGQYENARSYLKECIAIGDKRHLPRAYYDLARTYAAMGKHNEKIDALKQGLSLAKADTPDDRDIILSIEKELGR